MESFALTPSEMNKLYTPVPIRWDHESNRALGVTTPIIFLHLADHLRISDSGVWDHFGCVAEDDMKLTKRGAFLQTVRHGAVNRLAPDEMNCVCDNDSVLIRLSQGLIRQWIATNISPVWHRMHCTSIHVLLAIARLPEVDWDGNGVEWFPFEYERERFFYICLVPGVICKDGDRTEAIMGIHNEILLVYREEFVDRGMSENFAERAWHLVLEKGDEYVE